MTLAERFGDWACRVAPSTEQLRLARLAFVDALACIAVGAKNPEVRSAGLVFAAGDPRGSSLTALGDTRPAAVAAAINATAAHAEDFDDNFSPGMSHASAVLVPALIAAAEEADAAQPEAWERLLPAYIVGLQAQALIGMMVGYDHYVDGWHGTSTVGTIGTAAGVAYLHGDDPALIAEALSIAVSFAGGTKQQFGTLLKPLHAGLAARGAVEACALAMRGITASPIALEGAQGFLKLFSRGPGTNGEEWLERRLAIDDPGVLPKRYPSCGSTHLVLDGIDDLRQQHGFTADDVVRVHATVGRAGLGSLQYRDPVDRAQAKFSMDYCVRRFLRRGTLVLDDFADQSVAEARPDRTPEVELDAWADGELSLEVGEQPPHRVRLFLRDGTVLERIRERPKGSVREPFDEETHREKFLDCVGESSGDLYDELMQPSTTLPIDAVRAVLRRARPTA